MDCTASRSGRWLAVMREVAGTVRPGSSANFVARLRQALGITEQMATALLAGLDALTEFATAPVDPHTAAVDTEGAAVHAGLAAARPLLEARLQQQLDALDEQTAGATVCHKCGATAQSQGRRARPWTSLTGRLKLTRRYAYCEACDCGRALAQERLGLSESPFTPRLEEVGTLLATTVPHGMAADLARKLLGVELSAKGLQQMTERRAQLLAVQLHTGAAVYDRLDAQGLPVRHQRRPADAVATAPAVAYLEMDGVVPMTREEIPRHELTPAERARQQRARRAKTRGGGGRRYRVVGREVKNAVLYTAADCVAESASRDCITAKRYVSHLGDWETFTRLLWVEMLRQRHDQAPRLVVLSDGSEWIRSVCDRLPLRPLFILDLFHVKHRLWEVANLLHGEHTPAARVWAEEQGTLVEEGKTARVIATLRWLKPRRRQTREAARLLADYLQSNLSRMDYPAYKRQGLRVGSGAVESANYHVTGARLKLQGMRWSEQGAREMAYLRADLFNGDWEMRTRQLRAAG